MLDEDQPRWAPRWGALAEHVLSHWHRKVILPTGGLTKPGLLCVVSHCLAFYPSQVVVQPLSRH